MSPPDPPAPPPDRERIVVVIPCRDEVATVGKVVADWRRELPDAEILVVDNGSRDGTGEAARAAGATVVTEGRPGKGFALSSGLRARREADIFVMVDGDDTYPADQVHKLLAAARAGADMVIGTRLEQAADGAFRPGHALGNGFFRAVVRLAFGLRTGDLFSGYRVMSRRFVAATPLIARGFEVEAELSLQALSQGFPVAEVPIRYRPRPASSQSKLHTFHDGARVLAAIVLFFRDYRPLTFFGLLAALLLALSLSAGSLVIADYVATGLVHRLPLAVLAAALFILAALSLACGVLLSSINRRSAELAALLGWR